MNVQDIPLDKIQPPRLAPRLGNVETDVDALAASIERHGLISPITVALEAGDYRLLAGNRRYHAFRALGRDTIPANVIDADETLGAEITMTENLERLNLSPVEEAYAFAVYLDRYGETQEELATRLGKERTYVTRRLMLLDLDDNTLGALEDGLINLSQALILREVDDPEIRLKFVEHAAHYGATCRVMQHWVANYERTQARIQRQEQRDAKPEEVETPRQVMMRCDRCATATSYEQLRSVYVCPRCRQVLAARQAEKLDQD